MALDTNFNVNPYNDDFDEDKKFLRMLFKPGYAIQARELTQAQTILQKQIERFGNSIYKNGSVVTGGQTVLQDATYINVASTYATTDIVANNFVGMTILNSDDSKRAEVIKVYNADATNNEPITLMVKQVYGDAFTNGETIKTSETTPYLANIATTNGVGTGQVFSVSDGVYYYDGFFVKTDAQTVATNKYSNTSANAKIGFEVTESVIKYTSDTSLLDPAQDASNYQAPGSDRFKLELLLSKRSLTSTDTVKFIEIARVEKGALTKSYQTAMYSVLEDSLARRTYDESGNYTVRPFSITLGTNSSNTANMDITLSPGKAYVFGYEYETISPTTITIEKPRDYDSAANKRITADYGYFVYTNSHYGSLPIDSLTTVDLHCVPNASINVTSTASITNTKIGTARVKSVSFDSASNTSNSSTYEYKTYLFDVSVGSITGTILSANSGNVTIGNTTAGQIFSAVNDAYKGAKLRITSGPGSNEGPKFITSFTGSTQLITLADNFVTTPNSTSTFAIDFEFNDVDSLANFTSTTRNFSADIDDRSKDSASTYTDAIIADSAYEPLIFNLGQEYIKQNLSDFSFTYKRLYSGQTFGAADSPTLPIETGGTLASATTTSDKADKYQIIVTSVGTSPYAVGQTIPADKITNVTSNGTITVTNANTMTANIVATINYTLSSGSPAKTKTLVTANSTVQTTGGESINTNGVIVFPSQGQTTIEANNVVKTPDTKQSLYVSDVVELIQVLDFNGAAVANTGGTDITSYYTLDNGQRDSYYDHASIKLKPGYAAPTGPLVVRYNKYSCTSVGGFFTVDSYPTYETIPSYTSPVTGKKYMLRDCLDFRPMRKDATAAIGTTVVFNTDTNGPKIPKSGSDIVLDYEYYLPRRDRVVLNKNRTFEVIKGKSSLSPIEPKNKDDAMSLFNLTSPPYVSNTSDITVNYVNNRRYTMRDIGAIDKRVENLEYYTSLSLLEQDAVNKQDLTILDSTNLPRFKNGIIVDAFKGHSVADVSDIDYAASIDPIRQEMRPSFNVQSRGLTFNPGSSSNYVKTGPFVTVTSANTVFIDQPLASKSTNVNPFNVVNYIGKVKLNPPSDTWVDTTVSPDNLNVNIGGDKDAWDLLLGTNGKGLVTGGISITSVGAGYIGSATCTISGGGGSGATGTVFLNSGGEVISIQITNPGSGYKYPPQIAISAPNGTPGYQATATYNPAEFAGTAYNYEWGNWNTYWTGTDSSSYDYRSSQRTISRVTTTTTTTAQTRQGIVSQIVPETITKSLGERVVDVSIVPFMREKGVLFVGSDFKPSTTLYPFFDTASVEKYTAKANKFTLSTGNLGYRTTIGNEETLTIHDTANNTSNGTCIGVLTSNNVLYVVNVTPNTAFNASSTLVGTDTGVSVAIQSYEHNSGRTVSATSNTITLRIDATGAVNEPWYANTANSTLITIVSGTGVGQQRNMASYNAATRTATVSSDWSTTPDTTSIYSIGRLVTSPNGSVAGVFHIPRATFRVGEKLFRLIDNSNGDIPSSSTNGDATFFAQGLIQTTEETMLTTIAPTIQRASVKDARVVQTTNRVNVGVVAYVDPLAQTFLVSPQNFSQGVFIEKVRFCFKTKDESVPITLQIRPTVNGYPSSTTVYPYGSVTLTPDQVNTSDSPDFEDPSKYTDFVFDVPLYVQPGEHSFALVTNCKKYEAYIGTIGELDIVTGKQISEQPYGGSLFLSQNGSTWTADQNSDLMFRVYRKTFDTTVTTTADFTIDCPAGSNTVYDLAQVISSQVSMANTSVTYSFASETTTGGLTSFKPINQLTDYEMSDGSGRRVLNPTTGNTTFVLRATMATLNPDISPFLDTTRYSTILVDNNINNLPLLNSGFTIANSGSGYANSADVTVTVSAPTGVGTQATAAAVVTSNAITSVYLTNAGSGYETSPTITITPGSGGGSGASVVYNGEDKKSGGNAAVRYLTRKVTLADGFDSGDLRVYLTGYKPSGSNIRVYYKILSKSDNDTFDNKTWQLMTEIGNASFISTNKTDYRELTFAPGIAGTANNAVTYTSGSTAYNTFRTFAIKVVLTGTDTTDVPKVRDLRVIALPPGA